MKEKQINILCAIRALNQWRSLHQPTYVALRFLLDSAFGEESNWLDEFVPWKFLTRHTPRYVRFQRFKSVRSDRTLEYRDFYSASPTTAVAESWVLHKLSFQEAFRPAHCVFSYQWPSSTSAGRNFEHYTIGYQRRNETISRLLRDSHESVAVVADVRRFYPTANQQKAIAGFKVKVHQSQLDSRTKAAITKVTESFLSVTPDGIPIGAPLSHVLANITLEDFDKGMMKEHGERYTRYVDDIVLVVSRAEEKGARQLMEYLLQEEGLSVNTEKSDTLTSTEWIDHVPSISLSPRPGSFEELKIRLICYLAIRPQRYAALQGKFMDAGLNLPLHRMLVESSYGPMRRFMHVLLQHQQLSFSRLLLDSDEALLRAFLELRNELRRELQRILSVKAPSKPTLKKWLLQKKRYVLNRLLYLIPRVDYGTVLSVIENDADFYEHAVLLQSLTTGRIQHLIETPGPVVSSFAALADGMPEGTIKVNWDFAPTRPRVDSVAVLTLSGLLHPPNEWLRKCDPVDRELLSFCMAERNGEKEHDFSFNDEIRTLQDGRKRDDSIRALNTRFDDRELVWFDLLKLGGEYY